jgi:putative peptidoglycan lipid II flippase
MIKQFTKKSIVAKTITTATSTLLSRGFGLVREYLMVRYLGSGTVADAFVTAFKIPNLLRKVFAEGALSAAFVPTFVKTFKQHGPREASALMTLSFLFFEGLVFFLVLFIMLYPQAVLSIAAPGFSGDQATLTATYLIILAPFIIFVSMNALFAGALQAFGHFFIPAFAPVLLNIVIIAGLLIALQYNLPVTYFCAFILIGGFVQLCAHLLVYMQFHVSWSGITKQAKQSLYTIITTFIPSVLSVGMELSLFIDTSFASFLPAGSIALIYYANRFMGIPLGVFATSFSTILLPHFSYVCVYAPKRLNFYLLESAKLVFWVTIPTMLFMIFFSEKIFSTLFLSEKFNYAHVLQAQSILIVFVLGLFFFSLNKILLNVYYVLHRRTLTMIIALGTMAVNVGMNFLLIKPYQAVGLAFATTVSGIAQTMLALSFMAFYCGVRIYWKPFGIFVLLAARQLIVLLAGFLIGYGVCYYSIQYTFPEGLQKFFLYGMGYWMWAGPLTLTTFAALYASRKWFRIHIHFLD